MRRVAVTGIGVVSPLGCGVAHVWERLIAGASGIRPITHCDVSDLLAQVAGLVPEGEGPGDYHEAAYVPTKERRKIDRYIALGIAASQLAVEDAGWTPAADDAACERTGVMIGSGIGGLQCIEATAIAMHEKGVRRVSPFFIPASIVNLVSGHVAIRYGFKGPNHAVSTACSTGAHAIGDAGRMIQLGDADVMLAGGSEAAVCRLGIAGFAAARALSTGFNDTPEKASRPWDQARDGFVMGEGSAILVLEELEHAKRRGAKIYAELSGYGMSGDAYHITSPAPDGDGARRCMQMALERAGLAPDAIDYINAHGTSTPAGDEVELKAVRTLFGEHISHLSMSSTKSATGHLLGAAGALEAAFSVLSLVHQTAPPTLNLEHPCEEAEGFDLVPNAAKPREIRAALSNSFGFGGTNASLIFSRAN